MIAEQHVLQPADPSKPAPLPGIQPNRSDDASEGTTILILALISQAQAILDTPPIQGDAYARWLSETDAILARQLGPNSSLARKINKTGAMPTRFHEASIAEVRSRLIKERHDRLGQIKTILEEHLSLPAPAKK